MWRDLREKGCLVGTRCGCGTRIGEGEYFGLGLFDGRTLGVENVRIGALGRCFTVFLLVRDGRCRFNYEDAKGC